MRPSSRIHFLWRATDVVFSSGCFVSEALGQAFLGVRGGWGVMPPSDSVSLVCARYVVEDV
jgi:hypothetical protein